MMMAWEPRAIDAELLSTYDELKTIDRDVEPSRWIALKQVQVRLLTECDLVILANIENKQLDRWVNERLMTMSDRLETPVPWYSRVWTLVLGK